MDAVRLSKLIELIYDCAVDPDLWPAALAQIASDLNSAAATLNLLDIVTGAERTVVCYGISDQHQVLYRERYQGSDLFAHGMLLQPLCEPATSDDLVPESELLGSRIYREWAKPQGFRHVMLTTLVRSQARLAFLGVTRRDDQARFGAEDKAHMALIAPHVRRALTIADLIDHKSMERDDLAETLSALTSAVVIVGADSRLVFANDAGRAVLSRGELLIPRGDVIEPWDRGAVTVFQDVVESGEAETIMLRRSNGGHAIISALPLEVGRRKAVAGGRGRTALFVQDGAAHEPNAAEVLGNIYGLTGAELRVLLGLSDGETPKMIAIRYGIAASTVRTHLKSLFTKTRTNRQAELVKLLSGVPPITRPPLRKVRSRPNRGDSSAGSIHVRDADS